MKLLADPLLPPSRTRAQQSIRTPAPLKNKYVTEYIYVCVFCVNGCIFILIWYSGRSPEGFVDR
jgi:hypothetical protein